MSLSARFRLLLLGGILASAAAGAETFVVTRETDGDGPCDPADCTLREAVQAANDHPGPDVIEIPGGLYELTISTPYLAHLLLWEDVELRGDPIRPVIIDGMGLNRVIFINQIKAVISNVIIQGGRVPSSGAGIRASSADSTLIDCTIRNNVVTILNGGGVSFLTGKMAMINTTITGNFANDFGGGLERVGVASSFPADLTLINSTVSGNQAGKRGGAIYSTGGGRMEIIHSTVTDNSAPVGGAIYFHFSAQATLANSIISGTCGGVNTRAPESKGGNLQSPEDSCALDHPTDQVNVPDLRLAPLGHYGGRTPTHALLEGSPALDAAIDAECPDTDQRGHPRPADGDGDGEARCDAGAVEGVVQLLQVPTAGPSGLFVLVLLLGGCAVFRLRRRA